MATEHDVALVHLAGDASLAYDAPFENLRLGSIAAALRRRGVSAVMVDSALDERGWEACVAAALAARRLVVVDAMYRTVGDALRFIGEVGRAARRPEIALVGDVARGNRAELLRRGAVEHVIDGDPVRGVADVLGEGADGEGADWPAPERPYLAAALRRRPVADVLTSRGCPSRCSFCIVGTSFAPDARPLSRRWHPRTPEDIEAEVRVLVERHGVRRIHFADDNFMGAPRLAARRARRLARLLRPHGIAFSFYCRADAVEHELFEELVVGGLRQVHLGVEAGSDAVLGRLRKDLTVREVASAVATLRSLGVRIVPSLILFEERQTIDELRASLEWLLDHGLEEGYSSGGLIPLPGTRSARELHEAGLLTGEVGLDGVHRSVRFADARVGRLAESVRRFEQLLDQRHGGRAQTLSRAYHRYNDNLEVADAASPARRLVDAHRRWRRRQATWTLEAAAGLQAGEPRSPEELVPAWLSAEAAAER